jgi:hypothetical protein
MYQGNPHDNIAFSGQAQHKLSPLLSGLEGSCGASNVLFLSLSRYLVSYLEIDLLNCYD